MPCESYKNYLEAYCDDVLPLEVSQKVEAHLDSCDDCRKSVRDYQSLNVLLNSYVEQRVPEERFIAMRENILQRITAEDRSAVLAEGRKRPIHLSRLAGPGFSRRVLTFLSPLWNTGLRRAAVAVTCIVVLAVVFYTQGPPGNETALPTSAGPPTQVAAGNTEPAQSNTEPAQSNTELAPSNTESAPAVVDTGTATTVALATAGSGTIVAFADQVLDELNLMQLEMTASSEIEQLDMFEAIMEELTSFDSSADDG